MAARTFAPLLEGDAAAGPFGDLASAEPAGFVDVGQKVSSDDFVMRVSGRSMEDTIRDRALCHFRRDGLGPHLNGQIVLAQHRGDDDPEDAGRPVVKRLRLRQGKVVLTSDNPSFAPIVAAPDAMHVVARLLSVVPTG